MGNDDAPVSNFWSHRIGQNACDIFIRKSVKAVALHTLFREPAGQRENASDFRLGAVKGCVKTSDLRERRTQFRQGRYAGDVIRFVKRCKWDETAKLCDYGLIDPDRAQIAGTAMNHPVTGCDQICMRIGALEPVEKDSERVLMSFTRRELFVVDGSAFPILHLELCLLANAFDLALTNEILARRLFVSREERKLDAR
jgi:hypothetical protein